MIPHHGGAVLMCENANLQDQELKTFCQNIIAGQNGEIELMKRIMQRLDGNQTNTDTVNSGMRVEENAIYVEDQKPNTKVLVNTVTLSKPGFVVIHKNNNGNPGEVIGSSQYLPAGNSNNIVIKIKQTASATALLTR